MSDDVNDLLNPKVKMRIGLKNQGHIPTVEKMLSEHYGWDAIGKEIGWVGWAVADDYARYSRKELSRLREQNAELQSKYHELLFEVASKHPGETRHETALRYIRQAETPSNNTAQGEEESNG